MSLLARQIVPKSLAAVCQNVSVPVVGRMTKHDQRIRQISPRNAQIITTPAMFLSSNINLTNDERILLPNKLQESLKIIIHDSKMKSYSIKTRIIPPKLKAMAVHREISIKGKSENGDKEINLFVKTMTPKMTESIYSVPFQFKQEKTMYSEIFKVINELQEEANVPMEDRYKTAKMYLVDSDSIILEDLTKKGYTVCTDQKVMTLQYAEAAIKQLAKFHGMTFVFKAKRPEFFALKVKSLDEPYYYQSPAWNKMARSIIHKTINSLSIDDFVRTIELIYTSYDKYAKLANTLQYASAMVHNDFRTNNIMVKFNGNEICEPIIVDYQQTLCCCPTIDIYYFMFCGTDQKFRRQHLDHLKNVYHNTMTKFLTYFDLNINNFYPRDEFEYAFKDRADHALTMAYWYIPLALADRKTVPDINKIDVDFDIQNFQINDEAKRRIRGIVDDFKRWGYM